MIGKFYRGEYPIYEIAFKNGQLCVRCLGSDDWIPQGKPDLADYIAAVRRNGFRFVPACPRRQRA